MFSSGIWEKTEVPHSKIALYKTRRCGWREVSMSLMSPDPVVWDIRSRPTILIPAQLSTAIDALWERKCEMLV